MLVHEGHTTARRFFNPSNAQSYDSVVRLATFGQDSFWKREVVKAVGNSRFVLELACGTGVLSSKLSKVGKTVVGIDLSFEYLHASKRKKQTAIAQGTAEVLPYRNESFDAIVSSYMAKYVDTRKVVEECCRVLRPGGRIVFHDFTYPHGFISSLWNAYFGLLRLAGMFLKSWRVVFEQLDGVIRSSDWVSKTTSALQASGFLNVDCKYYTVGTAAIVSAEKP